VFHVCFRENPFGRRIHTGVRAGEGLSILCAGFVLMKMGSRILPYKRG
jgi:hypothetical protein